MTQCDADRSPLLVFSDDWGRHPSSCQHLVRHLLRRRKVCWVNTIGMRPPRLDVATLRRSAQKISDWMLPRYVDTATLPAGLQVSSPRMWPWFRKTFDRRLNRRLLVRQLLGVVKAAAEPWIGVTTLPITADLMGTLPVASWVYYCVDDFGQWPGLDHGSLAAMECEVVRRADVVVAASEALCKRIESLGREAHLLTHGVDIENWIADSPGCPSVLEGLERPLVMFWGLIDRRLDVEFVHRTAQAMERGTVVLVGPEQDPDPTLFRAPRVARVPSVTYEELPDLAHQASVLIMPYADLPVTQAMQPLKLKEYMATGKPVVARALPAVREWADCLDMEATTDAFAAAVVRRAVNGLPDAHRVARRRLAEESWLAKARHFEQLLDRSRTMSVQQTPLRECPSLE